MFVFALNSMLFRVFVDHSDDVFFNSASLCYIFVLFYFIGDRSVDFLSRFLIDFIFIIGRNGQSAIKEEKKRKISRKIAFLFEKKSVNK